MSRAHFLMSALLIGEKNTSAASSYTLVSGFRQDGVALDASHLSLEAHLHIPVATSHVLALPVQSELAAHSLHDPSSKHLWVDVVQLP